ncbi:hypothetical protein MGSAQ_002679, partial [marine sediment metagenome]
TNIVAQALINFGNYFVLIII